MSIQTAETISYQLLEHHFQSTQTMYKVLEQHLLTNAIFSKNSEGKNQIFLSFSNINKNIVDAKLSETKSLISYVEVIQKLNPVFVGNECEKLKTDFEKATKKNLILLNEQKAMCTEWLYGMKGLG